MIVLWGFFWGGGGWPKVLINTTHIRTNEKIMLWVNSRKYIYTQKSDKYIGHILDRLRIIHVILDTMGGKGWGGHSTKNKYQQIHIVARFGTKLF